MAGLVKHYQNNMVGIPQLSNAWGSMINLLDAVLVNGFNFKSISSLSKSSVDAITATINVGSGHGFIDRQVVRIAGSSNGWNGDYKVLAANTDTVVVECDASKPTTIAGTASLSTAPLDFEIVFSTPQGYAEPKRAYRSKDPDSLGLILLVHDFCMAGAAATGAKFAKVGVVSSMSDINTITGTQMPYDQASPNANWGWDGTYHGWSKWYYKWPFDQYAAGYSANDALSFTSATPSPFMIVGDSDSFLIEVKGCSDTAQNHYELYGIGEFYDARLGIKNIAFLAFGLNGKVPQSTAIYPGNRNTYLIGASTNLNGSVWFNSVGNAAPENMDKGLHIGKMASSSGSPAGLNTSKVIFFDLPITVGNEIIGSFPFLKMSTVTISTTGVSSLVGKYKTQYRVDSNIWSKYGILMENK